MVDKRSYEICYSKKDTVIKGLKPQWVIKSNGYFLWEVLLPVPVDCEAASSWYYLTKNPILWTVYDGRRRTCTSIWGPLLNCWGVFGRSSLPIQTYTQCLFRRSDRVVELYLMTDPKVFVSIPNCLDIEGYKMPVIWTAVDQLVGNVERWSPLLFLARTKTSGFMESPPKQISICPNLYIPSHL